MRNVTEPARRPTSLTMPMIRERIARRPERNASPDPMWQLPAADKAAAEPKRAAVAAVLRPGSNGPEVLLIRRAEHPNDPWSGHMAFPGGREDPCDADLFGTAVRETLEEVALDLTTNAALLGTLDDLPAVARGKRTGLVIRPFVFELTRDVALTPNYEVAEALWAPLEPIMQGKHRTTMAYELGGVRMDFPAHDVSGRIVWGLTYRMLDGLFALLS